MSEVSYLSEAEGSPGYSPGSSYLEMRSTLGAPVCTIPDVGLLLVIDDGGGRSYIKQTHSRLGQDTGHQRSGRST